MFQSFRKRLRPKDTGYSPEFFAGQQEGSRRSAEVILPMVISIVNPRSAVDVGCGVGTWASVLLQHNVDALGIDGDYVARDALRIPADKFQSVDLSAPPYPRLGQFDLALCLEVAEHLPAAVGDELVAFLVSLAPNILFGAAIPGQGGHNHINEQWQSYGIEEFKRHGLFKQDVIRPAVWMDDRVKHWYAQNTFLFSRADEVGGFPTNVVHPKTFLRSHKEKRLRKVPH
jgi:SAM-dependent methyltransferase